MTRDLGTSAAGQLSSHLATSLSGNPAWDLALSRLARGEAGLHLAVLTEPIGCGKTTVAALLTQRLGWPRAGYGDTIQPPAPHAASPPSRSILRQLGVELTGTGWGAFTRLVLDQARWAPQQPLILDGPRHLAARLGRTPGDRCA